MVHYIVHDSFLEKKHSVLHASRYIRHPCPKWIAKTYPNDCLDLAACCLQTRIKMSRAWCNSTQTKTNTTQHNKLSCCNCILSRMPSDCKTSTAKTCPSNFDLQANLQPNLQNNLRKNTLQTKLQRNPPKTWKGPMKYSHTQCGNKSL